MKISNPHLGNRKNTKPMHFLQWAPPPSPSLRDQSAFIVQLLEMKKPHRWPAFKVLSTFAELLTTKTAQKVSIQMDGPQ